MNAIRIAMLVPVIASLGDPVFAHAPATPFASLCSSGALAVNGTGMGRHMGESVRLQVRDLSGKGATTVIPAGWILQAVDERVQDLMLVRAEPLQIARGGTVTVLCRAFCVEADDRGPGEGAMFTVGHQADEKLTALAEFVGSGNYPDDAVLFSVWTVTGARPIGSIRADDMSAIAPLRQRVSELTGQAIPWYAVSYDDTRDDEHFSNAPSRITGRIEFQLTNNSVITIAAVDANGNTLATLGRDRHLGPGTYSMDVALTIKGWKRGTYSIRAYEGGSNLVKRIDFEV